MCTKGLRSFWGMCVCMCAVHTCCVSVYMRCVLCVHVGLYRHILHMQVPMCIICVHTCVCTFAFCPHFTATVYFWQAVLMRPRGGTGGQMQGSLQETQLCRPLPTSTPARPPLPWGWGRAPTGTSEWSEWEVTQGSWNALFVKFPKVTLPRMVYRLTALGSPLTLLSSRELCFLFIITQSSKEPRQNPASWHLHNPRGKIEQSEVPGLR